jgi:hypothetical protein
MMSTISAVPSGFSKDGPTYYTPERVAIAKENLDRHDWAREELARIRKGDTIRYYNSPEYGPADQLIEKPDDFLWMLMPTTRIARHVAGKDKALCPTHGEALRRHDPWCGYDIDPLNHPYKVRCKLGGEWWPSNDYLAGDLTSGDCPDDGNGCRRGDQTYYFLREYTHLVYGSVVIPSLRSLSQAWLLTGDEQYARAGCILLARLASEYPNYGDRADRLFYANYPDKGDPDHGWKLGGMVTDLIWETFALEATALAYDGLYDYMDRDDGMIEYLREKGLPVRSGDDLRRYIEDHILRPGIEALLRGHIHGNEGHHQASAAAVALVLDDYDDRPDNPFNSVAAMDYILQYRHPRHSHVGHSSDILINGLDRSGGGHESPNYNKIKLDFVRVNRLFEIARARHPDRFPNDRYPDLFKGPKVQRIFDYYLDITIHGYFLPSIGDCGGFGPPRRVGPQHWSFLESEHYLFAFEKFGDPRYARAGTGFHTGEPARGLLFEPYPLQRIRQNAEDPASEISWKSRMIDGYGVAILDSGEGDHRRAVMLNYSNLMGHQQCDPLLIQLFARGVDLLPDLGYPVSWDYRWQWDANSLAHNTVTVDETQPTLQVNGGHLRLFAGRDGVHVASASHNPYSRDRSRLGKKNAAPNDLYQRTVVLVDVDETRFYVVDLFAVNGGEQHDQSWHAMMVPPRAPPLNWTRQPGTLAGEGVAQFGQWTDPWGRTRDDFPSYITDVQRASLDEPAAWTWESGLPEGDALRMHVVPVGPSLTVFQGRGRSPARPEDWALEYLLLRRQVSGGERSLFLSVLDAYQGEPVVQSVRLVSDDPPVLQVERADGTDTIHLLMPGSGGASTAHRPVGMRAVIRRDDRVLRDVQVGEWSRKNAQGPGFAQSVVDLVAYETDRIALPGNEADEDFAPGTAIRIFNDSRSAMYRIEAARREEGRLWLTLDATALLARGRVIGVQKGVLDIDSYLPFADGTDAVNRFAGSWLGDETSGHVVQGVSHGDGVDRIHLRDDVSAATLKARYGGRQIRIWQFHPGDRVEAARVVAQRPKAGN